MIVPVKNQAPKINVHVGRVSSMCKKRIFLAVALFFLSHATFGGEFSTGYAYKGAVDLREISLSNGREMAYRLIAAYPASDVLKWYEKSLSKESFVRCDSSVPEWQSYADMRGGRRIYKFDRNATWASKKSKQFAILVLNYIGHADNNLKPDNADLAVSFQIIQAKSEKEFVEGLSSLDSSNCLDGGDK